MNIGAALGGLAQGAIGGIQAGQQIRSNNDARNQAQFSQLMGIAGLKNPKLRDIAFGEFFRVNGVDPKEPRVMAMRQGLQAADDEEAALIGDYFKGIGETGIDAKTWAAHATIGDAFNYGQLKAKQSADAAAANHQSYQDYLETLRTNNTITTDQANTTLRGREVNTTEQRLGMDRANQSFTQGNQTARLKLDTDQFGLAQQRLQMDQQAIPSGMTGAIDQAMQSLAAFGQITDAGKQLLSKYVPVELLTQDAAKEYVKLRQTQSVSDIIGGLLADALKEAARHNPATPTPGAASTGDPDLDAIMQQLQPYFPNTLGRH